MKTTSFAIMMICCEAANGAEPQESERVKYCGEMLCMFATPLESFFDATNPKLSDMADTGPTCCLRTASWFSGRIRIGKGKTIRGWSSMEGIPWKEVLDLEIEIKAGRVVSVREVNTPDMPIKTE